LLLLQMKMVQSSIALACLLAGADAFGAMPVPETCNGHRGNLALPANWGMSCQQVTPGYDPEKNNPDGSIPTTQCMRPSENGQMHGDHGHPMNQVPLADNFLQLTVSATKANATCNDEPAFEGHTIKIAVADVCPEACGKPCAEPPTENVPAEFLAGMFGQAPGFSCDSGLTGFCAGNQPVAWFCPEVCGKYNECSFTMGSPEVAGGAVVPEVPASDATPAGPTAKEQMVADCMTDWADSNLTANGWGSRAGCTSGQGQCCIVPFTSNFNCAAEAEEAQFWGYTDQPAVPAAAAVPAGVTPATPAVSSRDFMESMGSTEIDHCPMVPTPTPTQTRTHDHTHDRTHNSTHNSTHT
jgi:hypothetical protein